MDGAMTVTRYYFQNAAAPYDPATERGAWDATAGYTGIKLGTTKAGAATSASQSDSVNTANYDMLVLKAVGDAFASDGTISGNINWCLGVAESVSSMDAVYHVHIFVTVGDSDTVRGTVLTDSIQGTEWALTTLTGKAISSVAASTVNFQAGDRIVVEMGVRDQGNVVTLAAGTIEYGGTGGTDLTDGSTDVTNRPGWIEFDITFSSGGGFWFI